MVRQDLLQVRRHGHLPRFAILCRRNLRRGLLRSRRQLFHQAPSPAVPLSLRQHWISNFKGQPQRWRPNVHVRHTPLAHQQQLACAHVGAHGVIQSSLQQQRVHRLSRVQCSAPGIHGDDRHGVLHKWCQQPRVSWLTGSDVNGRLGKPASMSHFQRAMRRRNRCNGGTRVFTLGAQNHLHACGGPRRSQCNLRIIPQRWRGGRSFRSRRCVQIGHNLLKERGVRRGPHHQERRTPRGAHSLRGKHHSARSLHAGLQSLNQHVVGWLTHPSNHCPFNSALTHALHVRNVCTE